MRAPFPLDKRCKHGRGAYSRQRGAAADAGLASGVVAADVVALERALVRGLSIRCGKCRSAEQAVDQKESGWEIFFKGRTNFARR
jgi:hypothetical protein